MHVLGYLKHTYLKILSCFIKFISLRVNSCLIAGFVGCLSVTIIRVFWDFSL